MKIVFVGGWASSPNQYPQLAESARFLVPFTGFEPVDLPGQIAQGGEVLVGWSTGAHMLLKDCRHLFESYERVILIAPFLSFTDSFPERLVRRMISGMKTDPAGVVSSFHENCGETDPPDYNPADYASLVSGLEYLIFSKIEIPEKVSCPNLTIVHGVKDRIVRRKALDKVAEVVESARFIEAGSGHKISETELMGIIRE
ncbi:alpha/beta fold hydrolase [Maridesulfovibrio sp.]|uniref:alpha/beta fold hydrolase n=1 Tax=Maridesulfovibrio sp. TaxID=2795000 RepID=UPI0039EFD599